MKHQESELAETQFPLPDENRNAKILGQLTRIQNSHAFGNSGRAKQFLAYVVKHAVDGHTELLKERSIGVDLFGRALTYITGEDSIVRVQAADVRRRLVQYYAEEEQGPEVRIEIPIGSYIPIFDWNPPENSTLSPSEIRAIPRNALRPKLHMWGTAVVAIVLVVLGIAVAITIQERSKQKSALEDFWAPAFKTGQPVLIYLPSPVTYDFSSNFETEARHAHPGQYDSEELRNITPLQLEPDTAVKWKDIEPLVDISVNRDDAYVAVDLTELFARIHKSSQVRIGRDSTYEDLRNSPAVLIGAYDNPWTIRMASDLPFVFRKQGSQHWIEERASPNRIWRPAADGGGGKDFAIVVRLLNSKTGQFLVILGGLGMVGTQATGKFVSRQDDLDAALRTAPAGWQGKNLELVLETDMIEGSASPPRVLAVKTW